MKNLPTKVLLTALAAALVCVARAQMPMPPGATRSIDLVLRPVPDGALRIAYGAGPLQFGELRVPAGAGPHPVAILVHGGCWANRLRNLDPREVAIDFMRPAAAALTAAGFATWNVEYRRLGDEGGGWPGTFVDVGQAADQLQKLAGKYSLDLTHVITIGHSSGGHLALWLAARPRIAAQSPLFSAKALPVSGALILDAPADLRAEPLQSQMAHCLRPAIQELMGGTPEERPDRYRAGSPAELLPLGIRQELLASPMLATGVTAYAEKAKAAGDDVTATVLRGAGHFDFADPAGSAWPEVVSALRRLSR